MKKMLCVSIMAIMVLALSACGGQGTPPPAPEKTMAPPTPPAKPAAPAAAPAASAAAPAATQATAPAAAPVAAATDPMHQKLVGTHWMIGDFDVTFQDAQKVMIKGGAVAQLAPNGLAGTYSYENGAIKISALGSTKTGTWDGTKLVVDGKDAVAKSQ